MSSPSHPELDDAIAAWKRLLDHPSFASAPPEVRLDAMVQVSNLYRDRYSLRERPEDLDQLLALTEAVVKLAPSDAPERPLHLNNLATAREVRFHKTRDLKHLDEAIDAFEQAVAVSPAGSNLLPTLLHHVATAVVQRYQLSGSSQDLDAAIVALERASQGTVADASTLDNLANSLHLRFKRQGNVLDLERSLLASEAAVRLSDKPSPIFLANQAVGLLSRFEVSKDRANLDRSIELREEALRLTEAESSDRPWRLSGLGSGLSARYELLRDRADLDRAISSHREAVSLTDERGEEFAARSNNLGVNLTRRYELTGSLNDLAELLPALEVAVEATSSGSPALAAHQLNLAYARRLALQVQRHGHQDEDIVTDGYRSACKAGLRGEVRATLNAAHGWITWAIERSAWNEAKEAATFGLHAIDELYRAQLTRTHQELAIRQSFGFSAMAALAFAVAGDPAAAALALERGRALLLSVALERSRFDLLALREKGYAELEERYQNASRRLQAASEPDNGQTSAAMAGELTTARAEMDEAIIRIRQVEGYERFHDPASLADLKDAASEAPLVYLAATPSGGIALVVRSSGEAAHRALPLLESSILRRRLEAYIEASLLRRDATASGQAAWRATLDDTTRWLWEAAIGPIADLISEAGRVVLVPGGLLTFLPIHAAWTDDPAAISGRRYALDLGVLTYAPSARWLSAARLAKVASARGALVIEEPQPVTAARLPHTRLEVEAALAGREDALHLRGEQAMRSVILEKVRNRSLLHFACHSNLSISEPLESGLVMANDEIVSVRDLFTASLQGTRLAVLSACDTAVADIHLPDEIVGLPTSLLQAGAAGIIASLWPVMDESTMLLMRRFYKAWQHEHLEPADALRSAQRWMRDSTNSEKRELVSELSPPAVTRSERLYNLWATSRGYLHPDHWAAFTYMGV